MVRSLRNPQNLYYEISREVRDQDSLSRATIASNLNQSPSTVGRVVDRLISEKVVFETGEKKRDSVGRPSKLLKFNSRFYSVLTVGLRSTEVYAAITDLVGNILTIVVKIIILTEIRPPEVRPCAWCKRPSGA
jgi:hypothetical protein